jgi:hypothetical protein
LQWDRHCIENYLLDANAIYDVLQDEEVRGSAKPENRAEIPDLIKRFVAQQIKEIAISAAYDEYKFESPGVRQKELRNKIKSDVIRALQERISGIQEQVRNIDFDSWAVELEKKSASLEEQLTQQWSADWVKLCDGKRILEEIHAHYVLRLPLVHFKRRIVRAMGTRKSSNLESLMANIAPLLRIEETN